MRNILWCVLFLTLLGAGCTVIMHSENTVSTLMRAATVNM